MEELITAAKEFCEAEKVDKNTLQKALGYMKNEISASIVYEDFHDFSKGIKGCEIDYIPETVEELAQEMNVKFAESTLSSAGKEVTEISDEDAFEICRLYWEKGRDTDQPRELMIQEGKRMVKQYFDREEGCNVNAMYFIDVCNYLSSQGYSVPLNQFKSSPASTDGSFNYLFGTHEPWPLTDVLLKLIESTEYLLNVKNYDRHGWEDVQHCTKVGREYLTKITEALSKSPASTVKVDMCLHLTANSILGCQKQTYDLKQKQLWIAENYPDLI